DRGATRADRGGAPGSARGADAPDHGEGRSPSDGGHAREPVGSKARAGRGRGEGPRAGAARHRRRSGAAAADAGGGGGAGEGGAVAVADGLRAGRGRRSKAPDPTPHTPDLRRRSARQGPRKDLDSTRLVSDTIGVFGGSGFYRFLDDVEEVAVATPYGPPSARIRIGEVEGTRVAFMPRHGDQHELPAHRINYRANVWAMREVGVTRIIGPCACGSLQPGLHPGTFVIADQFVDRTRGRED